MICAILESLLSRGNELIDYVESACDLLLVSIATLIIYIFHGNYGCGCLGNLETEKCFYLQELDPLCLLLAELL